jgi:glycosyltransferase involved in cell wall biosynthesis
VLQRICTEHPEIRYLTYPRTGGQGKALQSGFAAARGEWVATFDADLDYGPSHIQEYLEYAVRLQADIVVGSPYRPGGAIVNCPWPRLAMSRLMNWYFRKLFPIGVTTFTAILRLYRRETLEKLLLASYDKDLLPEILIKADLLKMSIVELPAVSVWDAKKTRQRGKGASIFSTARKAARHLVIGLTERPFGLLFYPILVVLALFILMSVGVATLFVSNFAASDAGFLIDIRTALKTSYFESPHTFIFFVGAAQSLLIIFFAAIIVLQIKTKSDNDFIILTRIYDSISRTRQGAGAPISMPE